jgi:hypothetical protein
LQARIDGIQDHLRKADEATKAAALKAKAAAAGVPYNSNNPYAQDAVLKSAVWRKYSTNPLCVFNARAFVITRNKLRAECDRTVRYERRGRCVKALDTYKAGWWAQFRIACGPGGLPAKAKAQKPSFVEVEGEPTTAQVTKSASDAAAATNMDDLY